MSSLPSGWTITSLLELAEIRSGQVDPRLPSYRDLPLIAPDHIEAKTGRLLAIRSAREQGAISGKYVVDPGDVIYSKIRPYLMKVHQSQFSALCSADMYPMKPRSGVDGRYLASVLLGPRFTNYAVGESMRSGIPKVNRDALRGYELPAPPEPEQKAIGRALNHADEFIMALERLIAKKRDVKQGLMQELLTGRTRLPGFTGRWRSRTVGEVASVVMGQSPPGSSYNFAGIGVPLIQGNADIENRRTVERVWTTSPTKMAAERDVILTVRAPVGFIARSHTSSCLGRGVCALTTVESSDFLFYAMVAAEEKWSLFEQGSTFTSVNSDQVRSFILDWPADVEEQKQIAAVLDDVCSEIEALEHRLDSARAVKVGMMQELLTGRTRLPAKEDT